MRTAQQAPTGGNRQGRRWLIIDDAAKRKVVADLCRGAAYTMQAFADAAAARGEEQNVRIYNDALTLALRLHQIPVLAIPCLDGGPPNSSHRRGADLRKVAWGCTRPRHSMSPLRAESSSTSTWGRRTIPNVARSSHNAGIGWLDDRACAASSWVRIEEEIMQSVADLDLPHLPMEDPDFAADPFPHFAAARSLHPWLATSIFGLVVTEYGAMKDLLWMNDSLRTANDGVVAIMGAEGTAVGRHMVENIFNQQGDAHRRLRDALAPIFTPRYANQIRALVRETIDDLLDEWAPKGQFEFQEFASYFPISVLSRMIGGPVEAVPRLRSSLQALGLFHSMDRSKMPDIEAAHAVLEEFVQKLFTDRRAYPRHAGAEDLLDLLIDAAGGGRLSDREIADLVMFMYIAGFDTSTNVLTLIMRQMIERPELYQRCAADVEFCRKVVEEMLRFCGVSTTFRITTEGVAYRDVLLPKDTMIFFPVSVAGRDPGAFEDADRFDPDRPADPEHHIAFGRGAHVCLGQHLARVQLQEGLHRIAQRLHHPQLAGEVAWRPFPGIWGLKGLPITFATAQSDEPTVQ